MRFLDDRRGQSVVIGTVVLFGFLIVALAVYQAQIVPTENADVEFEHSQLVEEDVIDLRNSVLSAGDTGSGRSTSVSLGTRYPQRTFFVNPPPATGSLETTDPREVRIENVTVDAEGNVGAYWNARIADGEAGTIDDLETRSIRYEPDYHEYDTPPDYVYEHSLMLAESDGAAVARTDQTTVHGDRNRISLSLLDGDLSEQGTQRASVDPETLSQNRRTVTLNSDGDDPIVLILPTAVADGNVDDLVDEWESRVGDDVADVTASGDAIRIELNASRTYRLGLSKVGVGRTGGKVNESDGYITEVSRSGGVAVAEVRDRYNNPVEDANVMIDNGTEIDTRRTDADGRVEYEATDSAVDIGMYINENDADWESVTFEDLGADPGGGGGDGESGAGQGGDSEWGENDTTEIVSTSGGVWSGIDNVNAVILSNPRLSPINPDGGEAAVDTRYFRIAFVIGDPPSGETRYTFVFPTDPDDLEFEYEDGRFTYDDDVPILILEESSEGVSTLVDAEIDNEAFTNWYVDGEELNLLDETVYVDPNEVRSDLEGIREHLFQNEDQEAFITDVTGRSNLTLEQRQYDGGQADDVEYNDDGSAIGSGNAEVEFSVSNTGDETVEIESIAVDETSPPDAVELRETNGGTGPGNRDVFVSGNNDGYYEAGDRGNDRYTVGDTVTLTDGPVSIDPGGDAVVSLTRFYDGGSGDSGSYVDMTGETVTVSLVFGDGTVKTVTVET